ncbi:HD-GYP domain-containing protein [Bacillus sp. ISL-18]|uniref:HD-GYP domain-containing protein n=1 Tax=Bacillus sp. ISL-18 TaxID=2819118 RepID=UPI001BE5EBC0|nr:HD-GYP domain-containing protein [Bacillus sp. ISL-18]MBT2659215.1 HD-GYP domain-containing protein [Bacillus sp. ISL-18]
MNSRYNHLFNNPIYFKCGFIILMLLSFILNGLIINETNTYILYIFSSILLGIGFYNLSNLSIAFLTTFVVSCRFFLIPEKQNNVETFLTYLFTYLLITFISVSLMKNAQKVREDNIELTKALSNALDSRDTYTQHHSENVARYAVEIAKKMNLSSDFCSAIRIGGLLHDIGKIGIPEYILNKPDKLTDDEYSILKCHPIIGYEMIKHISTFKNNGVLDIILYHHERYDGTGYPTGLKGNKIPLGARIVAVVDAFDAMSSRRVYRNELDIEHILKEILNNKGTQFDPEIVDIFLSLFEHQYQLCEKR